MSVNWKPGVFSLEPTLFLPLLEWNTPPKPAWDLTDHVCGTQILQRCCGLLDKDELQFYYSDKQTIFLLSFTANAHLAGFCWGVSHLVFSRDLLTTGYCGLDNTWVFTGISFYFLLVYFICLSTFHSLNKISLFPGRRCQEVLNRTELNANLCHC